MAHLYSCVLFSLNFAHLFHFGFSSPRSFFFFLTVTLLLVWCFFNLNVIYFNVLKTAEFLCNTIQSKAVLLHTAYQIDSQIVPDVTGVLYNTKNVAIEAVFFLVYI